MLHRRRLEALWEARLAASEVGIKLLVCFAAVAEKKSFTLAARDLGISQPSVSEMIRRFETHLRQPLFVRHSRKMELTAAGAAVLGPALRILQANDEAQALVGRLKRQSDGNIRLGAPFYTANVKERSNLVGAFVCQYPKYTLDIVNDWNPELVKKLRRSEVDLAIVQSDFDLTGLEKILVHRSYGHFLVPAEDELASRDSMSLADLRGRAVVSLIREVDPSLYDLHFARLEENGAILVPTPEHHPDTMEQFARLRRLLMLRFGHSTRRKRLIGDMVRLPMHDPRELVSDIHLVRRIERGSRALEEFWRLARAQYRSDMPSPRHPVGPSGA